ncbi:BF3164 family lipoprotein [Parabacteroides pacaensis]|uniref:BF3164 family lipoprotein n=1 Tax=Parabacteroides pacaensis TaxID=2086575 RepID=UPI000D0EAEC4|nr:BF3164 family lipoprotein [Parabacteroides pacaensis]
MRAIITILVVNAFFSCTQEKISDPLDYFSHSSSLKAEETIDLEKYNILSPTNIMYGNNLLIMEDRNQNELLHIIDMRSQVCVHGVKKGEGPNEIISFGSVEYTDNMVYYYDIAKKIIYQMDPYQSIKDTLMHYKEYMRLDTDSRPFILSKIDSNFVATGIFKDKRYLLISPHGECKNYFVDYPFFESTKDFTPMETSILYISSYFAIKPDQTKFICVAQKAGVISFCQVNNGEIEEYKRISYHAPLVRQTKDTNMPAIAYKKDNKVAFCGVACNDKYIYALYSGRSFTSHGDESFQCEHLLVYDWNGNPIKRYHLDKPLFSFCLDSDNQVVYGITFSPEGNVVKYNLEKDK